MHEFEDFMALAGGRARLGERYNARGNRLQLQRTGSNCFLNTGAGAWLGVVEHALRGD